MPLGLIVCTTILAHTAFNGSRLTISLNALSLNASPLAVGVMMSLFAALPMLLGVPAGRMVDRIGVRLPILCAVACLALSVALPVIFPHIEALYFAAAGAGTSFMLFHIGVQHAVGRMSSHDARKDNFGWLALGFSTSNFVGPTLAGFAIDALGYRMTFCILAALAVASFLVLFARREGLAHTPAVQRHDESRSAWDLLRDPDLRRVFFISGLLASAWDLFVFVMPIYGTSIGLTASTIGLILGSFAAATFIVRLALPWLSRRMREWRMITMSFCIACVAYGMFPLVREVHLLASIAFSSAWAWAPRSHRSCRSFMRPRRRDARGKRLAFAPWSSMRATPSCPLPSAGWARRWAWCRCSGAWPRRSPPRAGSRSAGGAFSSVPDAHDGALHNSPKCLC